MLDLKRVLAAIPKKAGNEAPRKLTTTWGDTIAEESAAALSRGEAKALRKTCVPRPEYPHPQFRRTDGRWENLNGWWECAFVKLRRPYDPLESATATCSLAERPADEAFATPILVPFSPEAPLSGVERQLQPDELLWYRRTFVVPAFAATVKAGANAQASVAAGDVAGERVLLHFDAVDDSCAVFVNGVFVGCHQGAYEHFTCDITPALLETGAAPGDVAEITVCVADPSDTGVQLRGKQRLERGNIWYTAQSGIWQTVWLEVVPEARIEAVRITPDAHTGRVAIEADVTGEGTLRAVASLPVFEEGAPANPEVCGEAAAADGVARVELAFDEVELWHPDHPYLYDLILTFTAVDDTTAPASDTVRSYFAFRTCHVASCTGADGTFHTRFWLNDHPLFLKGVLDQGYWPDGLMTAPSEDAFAADILAMRWAGFTMLRKHIKVEDERFYYLCDKLGILVWQDMPSGGNPAKPARAMFLPTLFAGSWTRYSDEVPTHWISLGAANPRYRQLWRDTCESTVRSLANHPCIVTWVLFNEGWGQFASRSAAGLVHKLDATRPIQAVSGWYDNGAGDFFGAHNYFRPQRVFPDRFAGILPKGTCVKRGSRACVTDEFGGIVHNVAGHAQHAQSYGYDVRETRGEYAAAVRGLLNEMDALEARGLAGYVYTQVSDVEEETNGILTYDRRVNKLDAETEKEG
ncbi:MAG: glycoside hydrolase family 2 [Eggerthellaceae bacterium]|nr:glycoside hydrolase family 2 [Eggerthellaceae bacterium]